MHGHQGGVQSKAWACQASLASCTEMHLMAKCAALNVFEEACYALRFFCLSANEAPPQL